MFIRLLEFGVSLLPLNCNTQQTREDCQEVCVSFIKLPRIRTVDL